MGMYEEEVEEIYNEKNKVWYTSLPYFPKDAEQDDYFHHSLYDTTFVFDKGEWFPLYKGVFTNNKNLLSDDWEKDLPQGYRKKVELLNKIT